MPETFSTAELVIPGTYIRVQAEALIGAGGVSTGNIGVVGTARRLDENGDPIPITGETFILSDYEGARNLLGRYDAYDGGAGTLNLTRGVEQLYRNGTRVVFARALDPDTASPTDFTAAFNELIKDDVNILVAPELSTTDALAVLGPVLNSAENNGKDMMAVIGSDEDAVGNIMDQLEQVPEPRHRIILTAPGIRAFDSAAGDWVTLEGTYTAAAVAGLLSSLSPQSSPTNKVLPGVIELSQRFSYGELQQLVDVEDGGVMVLEQRQGVRVVRGLTTEGGAFSQVTTRRITDFAKAGIRRASDPFIGRLNNQRVRAALQGAIDGFLTTMVGDEALIGYTLEVTATRDDERNNRAIVNAVIQPTFSIDFVAVTMVLE